MLSLMKAPLFFLSCVLVIAAVSRAETPQQAPVSRIEQFRKSLQALKNHEGEVAKQLEKVSDAKTMAEVLNQIGDDLEKFTKLGKDNADVVGTEEETVALTALARETGRAHGVNVAKAKQAAAAYPNDAKVTAGVKRLDEATKALLGE